METGSNNAAPIDTLRVKVHSHNLQRYKLLLYLYYLGYYNTQCYNNYHSVPYYTMRPTVLIVANRVVKFNPLF
jgi:hypothetical protein